MRSKSLAPAEQRASLVLNQTIDLLTFPDPYAMEAIGNCLSPFVEDGARLVFSTTAPPMVGDLVALYLRSDLVRPGEMPVIVKRLVSRIPHFCKLPYTPKRGDDCVPVLTCASTNPRQRIHISAAKLMAVHKCIGVLEDGGILPIPVTMLAMMPIQVTEGRSHV
jgi:hypothetical protein